MVTHPAFLSLDPGRAQNDAAPRPFSGDTAQNAFLLAGLRDSGVEASPRRALPRVGVVHGRLLPHPRHRDQLEGQRLLGQGKRNLQCSSAVILKYLLQEDCSSIQYQNQQIKRF